MAVYSNLLLSAGGGIISPLHRAAQARNTASILIGLGGTGIDCLQTIKGQVHTRLLPDAADASGPRYQHIRFLGVDTDEIQWHRNWEEQRCASMTALEKNEYFSISGPNVKKLFAAPLKPLAARGELSWLRWEDINAPYLSAAGSGAIRQVGRFLMMEMSKSFMDRLEQEISAAKTGLNSPEVNIHIFSGLGGGTGSGCFLDVCYMARHVAEKLGGATICGYFFLPDVNLSRIPISDSKTRSYIPKNGYAAMQELDYCMGFPGNGGGFTQTYQDQTEVDWKTPPVNLCHLIGGFDSEGTLVEHAYDHAMDVTAEYVVDHLAASNGSRSIAGEAAVFAAKVGKADQEKTIGVNLAYCALGGACAYLPRREIDTCLASELFTRFGQCARNMPARDDVERLAVKALAPNAGGMSEIYNSLFRELCADAGGSFAPHPGDWKTVRDYGDSEMIFHYTDQSAFKRGRISRNGKFMVDDGNNNSLINRVRAELTEIIRDVERGPIFAHGLISASQPYNLLCFVDGLIQENRSRREQEAAQESLRTADYETARDDFRNRRRRSLLDNDQKRVADYEYYVMVLMQHRLALNCYEKLDQVLRTFRKQLEDIAATYYIRLSRVTDTLIESFRVNRDALASEARCRVNKPSSIPLVTVEELKGLLDKEVGEINVRGMFCQFMDLLLNSEAEWIDEDEARITRLVTGFCVNTAFSGFANRTITSFLLEKYGTNDYDQLADKIYADWMLRLTQTAGPLFFFNGAVWQESQAWRLTCLSIPECSGPVKEAAGQMYSKNSMWLRKESALTDRILAIQIAQVFPLCALQGLDEYEHAYFRSNWPGCHSYEGKPVPGMAFDDWRRLPPLTPQSLLRPEDMPEPARKLIDEGRALYDRAARAGIFDGNNRICAPDPVRAEELRALAREAGEMAASGAPLPELREMLKKLESAREIPMAATQSRMPDDGFPAVRRIKLSVQKDYFVSSPAYHILVRDILRQLEELNGALDRAAGAIRDRIGPEQG